MAKKVVFKVLVENEKEKKKAMTIVTGHYGVESLAIDMKNQKLTVIGDFDTVEVATELRKLWHTEILSVGPAKVQPEKKKEDQQKQKAELVRFYRNDYPSYPTTYYRVHSIEENPNACVIS